jgi:hypothetical protein
MVGVLLLSFHDLSAQSPRLEIVHENPRSSADLDHRWKFCDA